jgi:hypothetical protein
MPKGGGVTPASGHNLLMEVIALELDLDPLESICLMEQ